MPKSKTSNTSIKSSFTSKEIEGIKEALQEVKQGKFISQEEVKERFKKWLS